jgi:beta-lactamase regulating signal transducer with metallopeptidase domain
MKLSLSFSTNLEKTSRMALEISSNSSAMHLENAVLCIWKTLCIYLSIYLSVLRREMRERENENEEEALSTSTTILNHSCTKEFPKQSITTTATTTTHFKANKHF